MNKEQLSIVKIGGNIINNVNALTSFLEDFAKLKGPKILVHGGGKKATELANIVGLEPKMVNGRRITDAANLEIVTMVYAGLINKNITAQLQKNSCNAIGLSGADANCILAHKRIVKEIDYGFAGDIDKVNVSTIQLFLENEIVPVFCAITHDKNGQLLNTNADTIASDLAIAMSRYYETHIYYCFEKNGVLKSVDDEESVIDYMDAGTYDVLKIQDTFADGMIPKLENSYFALSEGVSRVFIGNPTIIVNKNQKFTTLFL